MNAYNLTNSERMPYYIGSGIFNRLANKEGFGAGCSTGYTNLHHDCGDGEIFAAFGETPVGSIEELDLAETWNEAICCMHAEWTSEANNRQEPMEETSVKISGIEAWLQYDSGEEGVSAEDIEKAEAELEALKEKLEEYKDWFEENPAPNCYTPLALDTRIEIIQTALIAEIEANYPDWLDKVETNEDDEDSEDGNL